MQPRGVVAVVPLLVIACTHTPVPTEPAPRWAMRAQAPSTRSIGGTQHDWAVKVSEDQILAVQPNLGLVRSEGEIRGRALGVPLVVGFHGTRARASTVGAIRGLRGAYPDRSRHHRDLRRHGERLRALDRAHQRSGRHLRLRPALEREGLPGYRGCGEKVEPISVSLPATMARWSDVEVAGAVGLLLNVGGRIRIDPLADNSARYRNAPVPDPALRTTTRWPHAARTGTRVLPGSQPYDARKEFLTGPSTWRPVGRP